MIQRRRVLSGLLGAAFATATAAFAQGMATRNVRAQPRGKPSGLPFHSRFVDVGGPAGLTHPVIYGPVDHKDYILESMGCGCAFIDYDNDGWVDVFVLNGTRFDNAAAGLSNRLYKNNRDGTFTDVTEKAGLLQTGWACSVSTGQAGMGLGIGDPGLAAAFRAGTGGERGPGDPVAFRAETGADWRGRGSLMQGNGRGRQVTQARRPWRCPGQRTGSCLLLN